MAKTGNLLKREQILRELFARSNGRACWGYDSRTGRGGKIKAGGWDQKPHPTDWAGIDRVCVEGEAKWTEVPRLFQ